MRRLSKIKSRGGFTLAETLLAVLILLLVSGIVATGVPVARNVYNKVIIASNAQVLLSTTVSALRDELGTAWDVSAGADGKSVTYYSADTGAPARLYLKGSDIMIREYAPWAVIGDGQDNAVASERALVSGAMSTKQGLIVSYSGVSCAGGIVKFTGLKVDYDGTTLATLDDAGSVLEIRVFSAKEASA